MNEELIGRYVRHALNGSIGKVEALYGPGQYTDQAGNRLDCEVIKLESGDAFIYNEEAIKVLTEDEVKLYADMKALMAEAVSSMVKRAFVYEIDTVASIDIIADVIAQQSRALK